MQEDLRRGVEAFQEVLGRVPDCSAAPAWLGTQDALELKAAYPFRYNSDCRGDSVFRPVVADSDARASTPDPHDSTRVRRSDRAERLDGRRRTTASSLSQLRPGRLNVLTIHAEVEGIACARAV